MPSPSTCARPPRGGRSSPSRAGGRRCRPPCPRAAAPGRHGIGRSSLPIPTDVALTTGRRSRSSSVGDPAAGASAAAASPRARRPVDDAMSAHRRPSASIDRPGRGAGAEHDDPPGDGSTPSARSEATNPAPSVLAPNVVPSSRSTTVLTERRAAAGSTSSTGAATSSLCGIVTARPPMPSVRIAPSARGLHRARPRTRRRPSRARRRRTRRCAAPARGCGAPASRSRRRPASRRSIRHEQARCRPGAFDVGLVLLERDRERVAAVLVGEHVVEVEAARVGSGSSRHIGSPGGGFGAGLSAARIDARPGWRSASAAPRCTGRCCTACRSGGARRTACRGPARSTASRRSAAACR
jgi:hypothetical protein